MRAEVSTSLGKSLVDLRLVTLFIKLFGVPHLGTRIRLKLLKQVVKNLKLGGEALDLGCGYGLASIFLTKLGFNVTGIDQDTKRLNVASYFAKANDLSINFINQDLYKLSFRSKFNLIICFEVIEHLKDDLKALKKMRQLLKKSGYLVISFPELHSNKIGFENLKHIRPGYTLDQFDNLANLSGFRVVRVFPYSKSFLAIWIFSQIQALSRKSLIFSTLLSVLFYPIVLLDQALQFKGSPANYVALLSVSR